MSQLIIDIQDKSHQGGGLNQQTIANFKLQIPSHQFVCLVGPSGCGKTTLLNMIAGLDQQYQGQILINQQPAAAAHIGYVFQNPRLLPWYNVRQNIEIVFPQTPPSELIDSLLESMQLLDAQHRHPQRLSLGMQRRVSIIRAFAISPKLLLMDEPFVSLDAPTARQIRQQLYKLWLSRPHTVLFVTHDLREAIALADRLIFLSASPMRICADIPVKLNHLQRNDAKAIEDYRQHLLDQHGELSKLL